MALQTFPFLAFSKKAPASSPTRGTVHLRYDNAARSFIVLHPDGTTENIGSSSALIAGTPVHAAKATNILTGTEIVGGDIIQIGAPSVAGYGVYRFVETLTGNLFPPFGVKLGVSDAVSLANLIDAINGNPLTSGTAYEAAIIQHPLVLAEDGNGDTINLTARSFGPAGNNIVTPAPAGIVEPTLITFLTPTFTGGLDATVGKAGDQLFDEDYLYTALTDIAIGSESGWGKSVIGTGPSIALEDSNNGFVASFSADGNLTADRQYEVPDFDCELAGASILRRSSPSSGALMTSSTKRDSTLWLAPGGVLATLTWQLPSAENAREGQICSLASRYAITALTVTNDTGGATLYGTTITNAVADTLYSYLCISTQGNGQWLRIQ